MVEVLNDTGFKVKSTKNAAIFDTLHRTTYFPQEAKFLSTKTDFLALDIIHLDSELFYKMMVNERCCRCWKMG